VAVHRVEALNTISLGRSPAKRSSLSSAIYRLTGYPGTRHTIAPRTQHGLPDIAIMRLSLRDSMIPPLHPHRRNRLHLTDNDGAISTDRKQTSRAAQCECEKGSDRPPTDMKAGREGPVSGREEVTGRAVTLPIQRKFA